MATRYVTPQEYGRMVLTPEWKARRDRYYRGTGGWKGYVCAVRGCGCRERLQLHHRTYKFPFCQEPDWALCWLCPWHHGLVSEGKMTLPDVESGGWLREILRALTGL